MKKNYFFRLQWILLFCSLIIGYGASAATPQKLQVSNVVNPEQANGIYLKQSGTMGSSGLEYWKHETQNYYLYCDEYYGTYYWNLDNNTTNEDDVFFYGSLVSGSNLDYVKATYPSPHVIGIVDNSNWVAVLGTGTEGLENNFDSPTAITVIEYLEGTTPSVTTQAVSSIATTTATGNGNVTSLGSPNPTAYGICWNTSSNPTISNNIVDKGAASATGEFTASITGLTEGTTYYVRAFATNTLGTSYGGEVSFKTQAIPTITWNNPSDIVYGTLLSATQLNAAADVPGTFTYTPALGTKLNAGSSQSLKVDFTPTDAVLYLSTTKTVTINVSKATPVIAWSNPAVITYGTLLSATQLNASADGAGTIVYTPSFGVKLNAGTAQNLKADFIPTDATNYNTATKTVKIDVSKAIPVITWSNPSEITYGTILSATQLNASADGAGTIVYTPALGVKLNAGTAQNLKADFTPTDATNYNTATKTVTINVSKATPVIAWSNPAVITYGTLLSAAQLNASADVAGTIVYTPALSVKLNAGTAQNLKADFTPTDATNYNTVTKTVTINVSKATPVIAWSNPAVITYGTLLSATQLNASADVAGTIVYTPALSVKLNAGTAQNLKADFTPTDATNYNTATKTVTIDVAKATPVINWSNPANISNQTPLSNIQLNATANVAGTFTYIPAIDTKLNVGDAQSLKADFEPTDVDNYETASKTVYINVFLVTGITELGNNELMLFPNPVIDAFSVSGIEGRVTISLSDLNGRVILTKEISDDEKIFLTNLSSGVYFIKIETNSGTILKKIVKN